MHLCENEGFLPDRCFHATWFSWIFDNEDTLPLYEALYALSGVS